MKIYLEAHDITVDKQRNVHVRSDIDLTGKKLFYTDEAMQKVKEGNK